MGSFLPAPASPGRPREFDQDDVIERAMNTFWSSGYTGTSMPALLAATGISRGSLYGAFGDKRGLFLLALDRYISNALAQYDIELNATESAIAGLRVFLSGYVDRTTGESGERGCLVVATTMEITAGDVEVRGRLDQFFKAMEKKISSAYARAHANGELNERIDVANATRMTLCIVEGLRVIGKTGIKREVSQSTVDSLLAILMR